MVREDYCRYQLEDGTLVKVKMCVLKIAESADRGPGGYPRFAFHLNNVVTTMFLIASGPTRRPTPWSLTRSARKRLPLRFKRTHGRNTSCLTAF